jgi:release factor glutamine methyltransferase
VTAAVRPPSGIPSRDGERSPVSPPPFSFEDHAELLVEAGRALRRHDLSGVHRYPTRYDPLVFAYEPVNLWHSLTGDGAHLFDRTAVPGLYRRMLARGNPALADLTTLTINQAPGSREQWERLFGPAVVERLAAAGALVGAGGGFRSRLRFVPVFGRLFVSDSPDQSVPLMVWLGKDTMYLLSAVRKRLQGKRFRRGLEVGSGTGLLTIALSDYCDEVIGVDINPRAVALGEVNRRINGVENVDFRLSDMFGAVPEPLDLVIGNVPFVYIPPELRGASVHSHGGEDYGIDLQLRVLAELDQKLTPDGMGLFLCCSPVVEGVDILPDRMRARFQSLGLRFEFEPLFNKVMLNLLDFHDSSGIQYTWTYIVTVRRAPRFELAMRQPTAWTSLVSWAYRSVIRAAHTVGKRRHASW